MARLEDLYSGDFINDETKVTIMHAGGNTTGRWYEDKILDWMKRDVKAVWYDKTANELDVMIDEEAKE